MRWNTLSRTEQLVNTYKTVSIRTTDIAGTLINVTVTVVVSESGSAGAAIVIGQVVAGGSIQTGV